MDKSVATDAQTLGQTPKHHWQLGKRVRKQRSGRKKLPQQGLLSTPFVQEVCHEMRAQGAVSLFSMPIGHKYGDMIPDPKAEPDAMHGETEEAYLQHCDRRIEGMSVRTSLLQSCSLGIFFQWQDTCLLFASSQASEPTRPCLFSDKESAVWRECKGIESDRKLNCSCRYQEVQLLDAT